MKRKGLDALPSHSPPNRLGPPEPRSLRGYAVLLLVLVLMLGGTCANLEIRVESASAPDGIAPPTLEALATDNAGLAARAATLRAQATQRIVETETQRTDDAPTSTPPANTPTLLQLATLTPSALTVSSPTPAPPRATPTATCTPRADWPIYTVAPGDTLYRIARATDSTVAALAEANCLTNPDRINAGQRLHVPTLPVFPSELPATINAPATSPAPDTPTPTTTPDITDAPPTLTPLPTVPREFDFRPE